MVFLPLKCVLGFEDKSLGCGDRSQVSKYPNKPQKLQKLATEVRRINPLKVVIDHLERKIEKANFYA